MDEVTYRFELDRVPAIVSAAIGLLGAVQDCEEWEVPDTVLAAAHDFRCLIDEHVEIDDPELTIEGPS